MRSFGHKGVRLLAVPITLFALCATAAHGPRIFCDEPVFDFGKKMDHESVRHSFEMGNSGDTTLVIDRVASSCGCTVAELSRRKIRPGEKFKVDVTADLSGRKGEFDKEIAVYSNDDSAPYYELHVKGEVIPSRDIDPRHIFFRKIGRMTKAVQSATITFNGETQIVGSAVPSADFLETKLKTIEAGSKYKVEVATVPPLKTAHRSAEVDIKDEKGNRLFTIPVWLRLETPVIVAPVVIDLDKRDAGPLSRQIIVRGGTVDEFEIKGVVLPGKLMRSKIQRLGDYGYRITIDNIEPRPELEGEEIVIHTDVPRMETIEIVFKYHDM